MRKYLFIITVIAVIITIAFPYEGSAQSENTFRFQESGVRAVLKDGSTVIVFRFDVNRNVYHKIQARVSLAWIDTDDRELSKTDAVAAINLTEKGYAYFEIPFPIIKPSIWTRLRYSITPEVLDNSPDAVQPFEPVSGIVSLSNIADHAFELKSIQIGKVQDFHGRFSIFAEAVRARDEAPVSGITWDATLSFGKKRLKPAEIQQLSEGFTEFVFDFSKEKRNVNADNETDNEDMAAVRFLNFIRAITRRFTGWFVNYSKEADAYYMESEIDEEVIITGRLGDFFQSVEQAVTIHSRVSAHLQTDKPIYQPGQTMHIRAILINQNGRVAEKEKVTLRIINDAGERVYFSELVSSSFGIIHDDWLIPDTAQSGNYEIVINIRGDISEQHIVYVSRYELPTFSVDVKTDRAAYLPGEQAEVTVTGTYLFGEPVPNGKVRIVREHRLYDYETDEEEIAAEGFTDEQGVFTAYINLRKEFESFSNFSSRFSRLDFMDLSFAAYYHDATSGRAEQRRFDIRITHQPIHVYYFSSRNNGTLPFPLYITTCYADGTPVSASLEILFRDQLIKTRSDSNGIVRVFLPGYDVVEEDDDEELEIIAIDDAGQSGIVKTENFWRWPGEFHFRLETERTIYRPGETVTLRIVSPKEMPPNQTVMVQALSEYMETGCDRYEYICGGRIVAGQVIRLERHNGEVTFPWQTEFQRAVTFIVWKLSAESDEYILGAKTVIFPSGTEIKIQAGLDRKEYMPGDEAVLSVRTTSSDGRPTRSALGVAIVDQSVMERAQTDSHFGKRSWFSPYYSSEDIQINGVKLNDFYMMSTDLHLTSELDLLAETLVARYEDRIFDFIDDHTEYDEGEWLSSARSFSSIGRQMKNLEITMKKKMSELGDLWDVEDMINILGAEWADLRDPWGMPYRMESHYNRDKHTISVWSSGPDKSGGNRDDFRVLRLYREYFLPIKQKIQNILDKQQGGYPATNVEFFEMLRENGYAFDALLDPWGTPYEVEILTDRILRRIRIISAGPDRKPGTNGDVRIAEFSGDYFFNEIYKIRDALNNTSNPPQTAEEFREVLFNAGIDLSRIMDAWGRPYEIISLVRIHPYHEIPKTIPEWIIKSTFNPSYIIFFLRSNGPNPDDPSLGFNMAQFHVAIRQDTPISEISKSMSVPDCTEGACNNVLGTVKATSNAVIPDATVTIIDKVNGAGVRATTDAEGHFRILSIPDGIYILVVTMEGFVPYWMNDEQISGGRDFTLNVHLSTDESFAGVPANRINIMRPGIVTDGMVTLETLATTASTVTQIYTPRVRDYFPETLLWIPELITDKNGFATTRVKLADTITNWKLAVIASTKDGLIAETETDFRTFQPFFIEFNPPQTLTVGDEVTLPVTMRNYLEKPQTAEIRVVPNDWSEILDGGAQTIDVPDNGSVNAAFTLRTLRPEDNAAQSVIAETGSEQGGDAIEKSLRVHPDGQEVVQTYGDMAAGAISFNISVPHDAISGVTRGQLTIYPNISSMLFESVSAMLGEPTGCGEQTVSIGYANLTVLRFARSVGMSDERIEKNALNNIVRTVERLKDYGSYDGGVGFYPHYEPETALTAYALSFLVEAAEFTSVRPEDISSKITWLEKHRDDWMPHDAQTRNLTQASSIARSLAVAYREGFDVQAEVLNAAYDYSLPAAVELYDEPYTLANFILTSAGSDDDSRLTAAVTRLTSLAREDRGGVYWQSHGSTPFHGWGRSGSYEVTGLAVSALSEWRVRRSEFGVGATESANPIDSLIRGGMLYLLRGRDRNGYWHSTQATLRAMRAVADAAAVLGGFERQGGSLEIRVNGKHVQTIDVDYSTRNPVLIDASEFLTTGDNLITITPSKENALTTILFSSSHWLPWEKTQPRASPELRLDVQFDKTEVRVGDRVRCSVEVERIGTLSRGMMIASIGLPPGAEVDRASLETLIRGGRGVDRYEVLPDRVIFYLWPSKGALTFQFNLSARFPMNAKSEPAILYDYYNPDALAEVPPFRWVVLK